MNRDQVRARTLALIDEQTPAKSRSGATLGERAFDSLDVVELQIAFEDEWDIELRAGDDWSFDTPIEQVVTGVVAAVCGGDA